MAESDFNTCNFRSSATFRLSKFEKSVPTIFNTKFCELVEFLGTNWPKPPSDNVAAFHQLYRYQRLKLEMDRLGRPHEAQDFFLKDLRATREVWPKYSPRKFLFILYEVLSNYGESVGRPIFWLFILITIGSIFFYFMPPCNHAHIEYFDAMTVSLNNVISFFPLQAKRRCDCVSSAFSKIIWGSPERNGDHSAFSRWPWTAQPVPNEIRRRLSSARPVRKSSKLRASKLPLPLAGKGRGGGVPQACPSAESFATLRAMSASAIRILGVDPGLRNTGWGIIDAQGSRLAFVASGCLHTRRRRAPMGERLRALLEGLGEVIATFAPA